MIDLKLFNNLPEDYKGAINHIVVNILGDESPEMNDAFRAWKAELFMAGVQEEDEKPDLKMFEIEALCFRDGWQMREQVSGGTFTCRPSRSGINSYRWVMQNYGKDLLN